MKRASSLAIGLAGLCVAGFASGAKVSMPKEGSYAFDFCPVGHGKPLSGGDGFFVMSYEIDALTRSTPGERAFDRMGARCYGLYKNIAGKPHESGLCEMTDRDGDKWWMDYDGASDGTGGTYKSVWGSGKYEGMTLQGEYHVDNAWGSPAKDVAFVGCNPNKGTYKLK
jgi:hypothetical protein